MSLFPLGFYFRSPVCDLGDRRPFGPQSCGLLPSFPISTLNIESRKTHVKNLCMSNMFSQKCLGNSATTKGFDPETTSRLES